MTIAFVNAVLSHVKIKGEPVINIKDVEFLDRENNMVEIPLLRRYVKKLKLNMKPSGELNELEQLLCFLGKIGGEKFMAELVKNNPIIAKMKEYEDFFRSNPAAVREYLFNQRFEQDMAETRRREREKARAEGKKEGKKEGREEATLENAKELRKLGILSVEQIAKTLRLPVETVAAL